MAASATHTAENASAATTAFARSLGLRGQLADSDSCSRAQHVHEHGRPDVTLRQKACGFGVGGTSRQPLFQRDRTPCQEQSLAGRVPALPWVDLELNRVSRLYAAGRTVHRVLAGLDHPVLRC